MGIFKRNLVIPEFTLRLPKGRRDKRILFPLYVDSEAQRGILNPDIWLN
jgi:hypothetical protein